MTCQHLSGCLPEARDARVAELVHIVFFRLAGTVFSPKISCSCSVRRSSSGVTWQKLATNSKSAAAFVHPGFTSTGWSWKCLRSCKLLGMNATNARDRQLQWGAGAARMLPTFAKRPERTGKRSPKTRRYKRRRRASSSAQKRLAQRDVKMYALGSLKLCIACGTVSTQCSSSAFVLNFVDLAGHFKV